MITTNTVEFGHPVYCNCNNKNKTVVIKVKGYGPVYDYYGRHYLYQRCLTPIPDTIVNGLYTVFLNIQGDSPVMTCLAEFETFTHLD